MVDAICPHIRTEIVDGAVSLRARLLRARPRVVCFNGKGIYEVFAGRRCEVGLQDATLPGMIWNGNHVSRA
jgi:TDG/mug DNA glycosylase family protein